MTLHFSRSMDMLHAVAPSWPLSQLSPQSVTSCRIQFINHYHALLMTLESNMVSICLLGRVVFSFFFSF